MFLRYAKGQESDALCYPVLPCTKYMILLYIILYKCIGYHYLVNTINGDTTQKGRECIALLHHNSIVLYGKFSYLMHFDALKAEKRNGIK